MSKFDKLNEFLEGELQSSEEQSLFNDLASDDKLRGEFKNLLAISSVVKNNRKAFAKNDKTKKAVFASLGLSIPVADAVSTAAGSAGAGAVVGYGAKSLFTIGALSAVATALLMWFMIDPTGESINNNYIEKSFTQGNLVVELPQENTSEKSEYAIVSSKSADESSKYKSLYYSELKNNEVLKQKLANYENVISNQEEEINSYKSKLIAYESELLDLKSNYKAQSERDMAALESELISEMDNLNSELLAKSELLSNYESQFSALNKSGMNEDQSEIIPMVSKQNNSKWSAEWRGSQTFDMTDVEYSNSDISQFNNNALAVMYNFDNGFSFGSEIRQETFQLEFNGDDQNGVNYDYTQEPNFTSLSVFGRQRFDMSQTVDPFAQLTLGGNKIGIVGRAMGGILYSPYSYLNMTFGLEYNYMSYQYQGVRFGSGKVGFNYGVNIQF
jgi:hypothetical protein